MLEELELIQPDFMDWEDEDFQVLKGF